MFADWPKLKIYLNVIHSIPTTASPTGTFYSFILLAQYDTLAGAEIQIISSRRSIHGVSSLADLVVNHGGFVLFATGRVLLLSAGWAAAPPAFFWRIHRAYRRIAHSRR
jgi:hypothetical protein